MVSLRHSGTGRARPSLDLEGRHATIRTPRSTALRDWLPAPSAAATLTAELPGESAPHLTPRSEMPASRVAGCVRTTFETGNSFDLIVESLSRLPALLRLVRLRFRSTAQWSELRNFRGRPAPTPGPPSWYQKTPQPHAQYTRRVKATRLCSSARLTWTRSARVMRAPVSAGDGGPARTVRGRIWWSPEPAGDSTGTAPFRRRAPQGRTGSHAGQWLACSSGGSDMERSFLRP